jgi:hypothetical protein
MSKTIEEQQAFIAVPTSLSQEHAVEKQVESEFSWSSCGESCLLMILPCLLFIQFGVAYLTETPPHMHWMIVNAGILCFIVTAIVFRRAFDEPESLIGLVPEVLIDVILGLILFEKTEMAAFVMFGSIIGMGIVAITKLAITPVEDDVADNEEPLLCRGDLNA